MKSSTGPGSTLSGDETMQGSFDGEARTDPGLVKPGDLIGRYVVLRALGRGTMGEVFAAYDPQLDRRIALKLLNADQSSEPATAEARAMARLSHPNVVTVHDVSEFRDRPLIAMEMVEGTTLGEWLESEPKVRTIVDAFLQAGRGLAAAHAAGVVHRDFKPANVLVEVDANTGALGRVRVVDFGLAVPSEGSEVSLPVEFTYDRSARLHAFRAELHAEVGQLVSAQRAVSKAVALLDAVNLPADHICTVKAALVRVAMPRPDPNDVAEAKRACATDPPRPEAAWLAELEDAP